MAERITAPPPLRQTPPPARVGLADLHCHTTFSDGQDSPDEVYRFAARLGLDVLAVTDHDTVEGAQVAAALAAQFEAGPDVVVGEEVTSAEGHILGLYLHRRVRPGMSAAATVDAIHDQGGLAIAAHPYWVTTPRRLGGERCGVGDLIATVPFDAVEVINGGFTPSMVRANLRAAAEAGRLRRTCVGGSDAHLKQALGWGSTEFRGRGANDLRAAILSGATRPRRGPLDVVGITRYLAWGLSRPAVRLAGA